MTSPVQAAAIGVGMFALTALTFVYLAVVGVLVVPILLALGYLSARRVAGARIPVLVGFLLGPLLSPETFAGWARLLQGQNPGGPNGMLVLIHIALVVLGSGVMLLSPERND